MTITVRLADRSDAPELARVQVESWRSIYRGLMAEEILNQLDFLSRTTRYWATQKAANPKSILIATALLDNKIVGLASSGPPRDLDAIWERELYVMYTDAAVHEPRGWTRAIRMVRRGGMLGGQYRGTRLAHCTARD